MFNNLTPQVFCFSPVLLSSASILVVACVVARHLPYVAAYKKLLG